MPLPPDQRVGFRVPPVAMAVPTGPTTTPNQGQQQVSGFRKALMQTVQQMGGEQSEIQDALLDGLRKTAEEIVQQNRDIFGDKFEKTVDQSAAYEIFEKVVDLSEQAATARTVEQKRKILQRLQTFKRVAQNVFGDGGKQAQVAQKLIEIIEKIEQPLLKETGVKAAAKEKITDIMRALPEKMAAKIPLVGGIISRSLKRRREKKEEEADALASITEEISRAGRTSLYGRGRGGETGIGPTPSEPPIEGGVPASELGVLGGGGMDRGATNTLGALLVAVQDIRRILLENYDPEDEELRQEEARREEEDRQSDMMNRMRGLFGARGGRPATGAAAGGEGGGLIKSILDFFGLGKLANIFGALGSTVGGIATRLGSMLSGLSATVGSLAMTVGRMALGTASAIGSAAAAAAPWITAAGVGAGIGTGAAYVINKGIDTIFGTDLSERQFQKETYTFSDVTRDRERKELGKKIVAEQKRQANTKEFIESAAKDPRMLPKLVGEGKLTGNEAMNALKSFEAEHGIGEDTQEIRKRILQMDPSAAQGSIVPSGEKTIAQQTLAQLEQSQDALAAETSAPQMPMGGNTVVAPTTNTTNTTINNNSGNTGVRNNEPTLKAAERASM